VRFVKSQTPLPLLAEVEIEEQAPDGQSAQLRGHRCHELNLTRLDALEGELSRKLAEAEEREAADAMAEKARDAAAKIEAFNTWLATHAAALREGLELERAAWAAMRAVPRDVLPAISRAHVGCDERGLGFLVRLPGAAGTLSGKDFPMNVDDTVTLLVNGQLFGGRTGDMVVEGSNERGY
jgi:hypothetical protein